MSDKQIKAVFVDIDGTLGIKNKDSLSYNLNVINNIRKMGHKVFINTGRTSVFLPKEIDYEKNFDGAVLGNGSHIIIDGKTVFSEFMGKDFLLKSFDLCLKNKLRVSYEGDDNVLYYFNKEINAPDKWIYVKTASEFEQYLKKYEYRKITYVGEIEDPYEFEALSDKIKVEAMGMYDGIPTKSGEIIIKNTGKDKGIERVINYLSIDRENTIAIGDSMNDYHMLKYAGVGIAVSNAEEIIKEIADFVTDDCNSRGVGKALNKLFNKEVKFDEKKC